MNMDLEGPSQIASDVEALVNALEEAVTWLESSELFTSSHGAHFAAVEARKLLARVREP